ncbi:hypothetical protein HD_0044 [[Haemophilus] ducreyi 35000HP]|uniref:Uncharacterized protein n=1 Tax=Haemophilus ducreyi (strain 35000HP / ATCC 700724) TaxID=233412 RepID=Q7VPL8_HAEDU|nr:hypothetical protein HD_0044 [[Haemophilus] ducreyi 35000HP]
MHSLSKLAPIKASLLTGKNCNKTYKIIQLHAVSVKMTFH